MLAMATIQVSRDLSNNIYAVRKRRYRAVEKEKKRRTTFVHEYVRTKYPNIYTEANSVYQTFVEKYPGKPDFTKVYYFKKWQRSTDLTRHELYIPHLPILRKDLSKGQQSPQQQEPEQPLQQEEEGPEQQSPQQQQQEEPEQPQQQEEEGPEHQSPQQQQEEPEQPQQQEEQEPEQQSNNLFHGMTLDEMDIAASKIVAALQSDRELMDIVESFDLPDGVWNNELSVPDYILETDLDW